MSTLALLYLVAVELLERMLDLDPERRIDVNGALEHPYLAQYHDSSDEPTAPRFDQSFEAANLDMAGWKG